MIQNMQHPSSIDSSATVETKAEQGDHYAYLQALQALRKRLHGELVLPEDAEYESARTVWNGEANCHPVFIVRCLDAGDVVASVTFAKEQGLTGSGTYLERGSQCLQPYGLALTSGDTGTVGVGGLMLGGGIGWMVRKYGMTIDHLRAVELVTADGQHLRASSDEHPDLFWGLRGGGGNFGIATAFEVEIHRAGMVLGGAVFYEMAEAEAILQEYARYAVSAPEELTTMALLMAAPPAPFIPLSKQGVPVVAIFICYTGDLAQGEHVITPLRQLGTIVADVISPIPYPVMFAFTEEASKHGFSQYVRSLFDATAFAHRDKQAMVSVFDTEWQPGNNEHLARAEQLWQAISPYAEGVYVNFLADEGEQRIHQAYPLETYTRLAALKERYDPTNLFHFNQNIRRIHNS